MYKQDQNNYIVPYGFKDSLFAFLRENDISYHAENKTTLNELKMMPIQDLSLYDYQEKAVDIVSSHTNGVLVSPTGSGKTRMGMALIGKLNVKTLWITNKIDLLTQSKKVFESFYSNKAGQISGGKVNIQDVTFATVQTLNNVDLTDFKDTFGLIIVDECFTGDTEILTDKGYIKFKDLKDEKVAQYHSNGDIKFVKPIRKIKKHYEGEMIDYKIHRDARVLMTPNHRQIYRDNNNNIKEVLAKDINRGRTIVAGKGTGINNSLSYTEKLLIMTQADGYKTKSATNQYQVQFNKDRKVERFLDIVDNLQFDIRLNEVKARKGARRFTYYLPEGIYPKLLSNVFHIDDFGYQKAREFIDEVCFWDGYSKNGKNVNYDSIVKENVNFVSAIATLGGYKNYQIVKEDNRSENFSDIHRVFFVDKETKSMYEQKQDIKTTNYKGDVYCVEVETGMIVVRSEGHTFISGNCHRVVGAPTNTMQFYKVLSSLNAKYKYGLTATMFNKPNYASQTPIYVVGEVLHEIDSKDIPRVNATHIRVDLDTPTSDEYLMPDRTIDYMEQVNYLYNNYERNIALITNMLKNSHRHNIVLSNRNEHLNILKDLLESLGMKVGVVIGETKPVEREKLFQEFREGKINFLLSNYMLLKEGQDLPIADTLHLVMPVRDKITTIQSVGRIERLYKGKKDAFVFDYVDKNIGNLIGMFTDRRRHLNAR
ncbi:MAG TPA: DEAD/DEAH box helicase family protein [Haploplasma sp.]|nr:DEAD/DEAH box helicase family protein [Haploplasma sp.]